MAAKQAGTRRKSEARIAKDRKKKADAKRRKTLKTVAMIVLAIAVISLIIFAFAAPPRPVM